ncbi:hypothetical protein D3C86_2062060 [compost metagenome]
MIKDMTGSSHALPDPAALTAFNAMNTEKIRALGWQPGGIERLRATVASLIS